MSCKFDWNTQSSVDIIINVFIIVLSIINVINLLDLCPGRSGKAFLFLSMIILLFADWSYSILPLSLIIGSLLVYLYWDLKSYVMMGDTGSNALGVVIGITAILVLGELFKLIYLACLIFIHLFAEKYSITTIISNNKFLNFIDKLGRR